jgi:hypothetical protein
MLTMIAAVVDTRVKQVLLRSIQRAASTGSSSQRASSGTCSVLPSWNQRVSHATTTTTTSYVRLPSSFCVRSLSSTVATNTFTTATATTTTTTTSGNSARDKTKDKTDNIFLDNLGTIFLSAIGVVVAWLMRSYYNSKARNMLRDIIEQTSAADPIELDDVRVANSELVPEVFYQIQQFVLSSASAGSHAQEDDGLMMTYPEFVKHVRTAMMHMKGDAFTIQLAHVLDRVAAAVVLRQLQQDDHDDSGGSTTIMLQTTKMSVQFWLTLLSLSYSGSLPNNVAQQQQRHQECSWWFFE